MNLNHTLDRLFAANALHLIPSLEVHGDRVARGSNRLVQLFDLGECGFETVPLRFVLFASFGFREWVGECGVVGPELEFL